MQPTAPAPAASPVVETPPTESAAPETGARLSGATLERIRNEPQFQQIRQIIRTNPHLLQQFIQQLQRENPDLFQVNMSFLLSFFRIYSLQCVRSTFWDSIYFSIEFCMYDYIIQLGYNSKSGGLCQYAQCV